MASDYREKDYDDEVYEDDYYEKNYEGEELEDESELIDDGREGEVIEEEEEEEEDIIEEEAVEDPEWDDDDEKKVTVSYACDECDYRWDDIVIKKKTELVEEEHDVVCPMCGSMNVTLI